MTFTFPRLSAGIYEVQKDSNTVGFIRKVNATKWMVVDVVDTPQHVTKTLKEAKDACMNVIIFDNSEVLDNTQETEYDDSVEVEDKVVVNTLDLQKQMLASMKTYVVGSDGNFAEVKEPTLEPIEF